MNLIGAAQVILRERTDSNQPGRIIKQSPWAKNNIVDIWKMRSLVSAKSTGTVATALRGLSKPNTGQYVAPLSSGDFGIYAMNAPINIGKSDIIPPYVNNDHCTLKNNVSFWNVNNNLVESATEMLAVDNRSTYSYHPEDASYTVRYVKNTGAATITGVCFGRNYTVPEAHHGILLGDFAPRPSTAGTVNYFLEHKEDRTLVWKYINASSQFSYDLKSKVIQYYANSTLQQNIANAALLGGLVIGNQVVKAAQQTSSATTVVVRLTGCLDFTTSIATSTLDINFDGEGLNTSRKVRPVLVARPDINAYEVFVPMEIQGGGVVIKKATVTNVDRSLSTATVSAVQTVATLPYLIGAWDTVTNDVHCTGFYDVANAKYYLPYTQYVNTDGTLSNVATATYQPGIVVPSNFSDVEKFYLARTDANFNAPCLTDEGVLQCRVNTTTMYYFYGSGLISGTNFSEPYIKAEGNVLEIVYKYTFE
jgi:hypothetical protein